PDRPSAEVGGRLLRGDDEHAGWFGRARQDPGEARRDSQRDSVRERRDTRRVRRGGCAPILGGFEPGASRDVSISGRLSWQSEPSAFLLGRLRPRCDAILGPDRAETPRRDTELTRLADGP